MENEVILRAAAAEGTAAAAAEGRSTAPSIQPPSFCSLSAGGRRFKTMSLQLSRDQQTRRLSSRLEKSMAPFLHAQSSLLQHVSYPKTLRIASNFALLHAICAFHLARQFDRTLSYEETWNFLETNRAS